MTEYYKNKIEQQMKAMKLNIRSIEGFKFLEKDMYDVLYTYLEEKDAEIKKMSLQIDEEIKALNETKDMIEDLQKEADKVKITLNKNRLSESLDQSARKVVNRHITKEQFDSLPEDIKAIVDPSRISAYEGKGRKRKTQGKRKGNKKSQRK